MKVAIVEDEPLARQTLSDYLREEGVECVAEAADGITAVKLIERHAPEVVFLDIRLPELSGLEVLSRLELRPFPLVVFTTAYDRYAVAAFELEAVDYLVKPFGRRRFATTLARVRRRLAEGFPAGISDALRTGLLEHPRRRLFARQGDSIVPVAVESIEHVSGADDYSRLHCGAASYLVTLRLRELERLLDPELFLRIHRSHLINLDQVTEIRVRDPHRLEVVLVSGASVPASRTGSARLRGRIRT